MNEPTIANAKQHDYTQLSDLQLLDTVIARDEGGWSELLRRFRGLIYRCIHKAVGKFEGVLSNETADEVFSEVCYNLLRNDMRKLRLYDPQRGSKLGSWIGLIAINTAYDHLRRCARRPVLDQIDGCPERVDQRPTPLDTVLEKERWIRLERLTSGFSPRDRRFVELYFRRGMSPAEVALRMEISVKTVYSKKNKIRKRLLELAKDQRHAPLAA